MAAIPAGVKPTSVVFAADYMPPTASVRRASAADGSRLLLQRRRGAADEWWHVPGGRPSRLLPQWWLCFQQWALTFQPAQSLVTGTLLPLQIAGMSPREKGSKLGVANAVGAVAQMMQPIFGTVSDRSNSRWGRRRLHVWWSSWLMVAGTLMMATPGSAAVSTGWEFTALVVGYGIFQVSTVWYVAPSSALVVDLVAPTQYGMANGWGGFWSTLSGLASNGLTLVVGTSLISVLAAYIGCAMFDLVVMVATIVAFSAAPGCCQPEPPAPPPATGTRNYDYRREQATAAVHGKSHSPSEWCSWCWKELRAFAEPLSHRCVREKTSLFSFTFHMKHDDFTKTGSGQTHRKFQD